MSKNILILILSLLLIAIFCTSCKDDSSILITNETDKKETTEISLNETIETDNDEDIIKEYSIIESKASHNEDDLIYIIRFPQIEGLGDIDKQERINEIIKNEAIKVLNYYKNPFGTVEIDIAYKVTLKTPRIISIQYYGSGVVSSAAHPNKLFYTTNIVLTDETKIRLSDIVRINSDFIQKFVDGEFNALWLEQSERINLHEFTIKELMDDFTNADSFENIETEKQSDVFSYLTEDSLGISIPVPYAIGGHAEYEIEYQNIQDNIVGNVIWDEILTVGND